MTTAELAQRVGRSESAVRNQENGTNGIPAPLARKYASALGTSPAWLLYGDDREPAPPPPVLTDLPLIGPVQAGSWLALDDTGQDEPQMMAVALDRRYPHARQWLREVRGDSMNARNIYPDDLVHLVDLGESGINLNTGMIVEVHRTRDGGALREITLKEVEVTPGGLVLWPRSNNPRWTQPVLLRDEGDAGDIQVEVTGVLIAKITRF